LPAGKTKCALVQTIFDFVPERRAYEATLDGLIYDAPVANSGDPKSVSYILIYRLRKRIRLLENHSYALPKRDDVHVRPIDIHTVDPDLSRGNSRVIDQVVHPIR
jgi:hypothetical protein